MNSCPFCSNPILRHFRPGGTYWFCHHCWQEVPNIEDLIHHHQRTALSVTSSEIVINSQLAVWQRSSTVRAAVS